ncbi:unnamed protein product [Brachionus calyciflorus]|uniref:Calponin-homology (CH) domain-containing protein n=1 Tax=Brachionus calyciflorus TaxID=104777 RepID=A0A813N5W9_9BILA|nr:unnamed protein product [Brachionus calyciflorus]
MIPTNPNDPTKTNDNKNDIPLSFASFYYSLKVTKGKDEREDVQKKTFTKWINSQLSKINHPPINDLFNDLKDGSVLLKLLELLTGKELKKEIGNMKMHHLLNLNLVLSTLKDHQIRLINISSNDINDGNPKLTLGLVWNIIQHWQVRDVLRSVVYDIHATNLEKALLKWCQESTKNYPGVCIKDFTNSWKDGLAFNAIIHKYRPDLFSYEDLYNKKSTHNPEFFLRHAFDNASRHLSIENLLDIEDVLTDTIDKKSIMMYVMCYFQVLSKSKAFKNIENIQQTDKLNIVNSKLDKATITHSYSLKNLTEISCQKSTESLCKIPEELQPNELSKYTGKMSSSSSTEASSEILETYLSDLKKVIEWLINSESLLNTQTEIGNDVNTVKEQFQTHEDFMLDLTKHQNNVGIVLQEGNRIVNSKLMSPEDENEVRKQMKLLNDMWENLRILAVERQAKLHESLMKLQMEQLNQMDTWLQTAEARIQNISQLADSFEGLIEQKDELSRLQDDLVKEQEAVDCLKQIIVVVDDNTDDQAFNDLESKLANLSDRWSNVCKFVGNRWFIVQDLLIKLKTINAEFDYLNEWITNKTTDLNILIVKTKSLVEKNNLKIDKTITLPNEYADIESEPILTSSELIKILKEIELEMQSMHSKLNDMNEIGEQIGTQLSNSPKLSASINSKMDVLEIKWNTLLEQMEYLSKVGTEQQQFEIMKQMKKTSNEQTSEVFERETLFSEVKIAFDMNETDPEAQRFKNLIENDLNNFNIYLNQMNNLFKNCQYVVDLSERANLDEQNETYKKCIIELSQSQEVLNKIKFLTNKMSTTMRLNGLDPSEISSLTDAIEQKWKENVHIFEELNSNQDKNGLDRRAFEELSTLRDVFDGYNKYIQNAEPLSVDDIQKLSIQLETNKVKQKGMKSYEIRLNDLKTLASQLKSKDLANEIEQFYLKWMDTFALIKKRNEDIIRIEADMISNKKRDYIYENSYNIESSALKSNSSAHYHVHRDFNDNSLGSSDSGSDENILHVVTNVYTIPITKTSSGQSKITSLDHAESQINKQLNEIKINLIQPSESIKNESKIEKTEHRHHKSIDLKSSDYESSVSKSKFQIKSIVEIYESQESDDAHLREPMGIFKTNNQVNHTVTQTQIPIQTVKDQRQSIEVSMQSQSEHTWQQYQESRTTLIEWLTKLEKSIDYTQIELNYIPVLEEKLSQFQEYESEIKAKKSLLEIYKQNLESVLRTKKDLLNQLQSENELIQMRYKKLSTFVHEKLDQIEKSINDLKTYQNEYTKVLNEIKTIDTNLQIEHHATSNNALEKTLEEQLNVLRLIKHDIDELNLKVTGLNDLSKKYLLYTNSIDLKFQNKLKQELFELNENFSQLKNLFANKKFTLEDILTKSNKVDSRVNDLENWITLKNNEILENDGVIITEEQFDQRCIKYKQIKSEIERKAPEVKQLIENGNEMIKTTNSGITAITELANNMSNLNSNWTSLNQKIDAKLKDFTKLESYINELRQLIYQENRWVETVQNKMNSIEYGNDAEELSELIDNLENQFKYHKTDTKERIGQLSNLLVESNILIQLNNSDVKEYIFKYQLVYDEAQKRIKNLEESLYELQTWEKKFAELQDWIGYMDKYLSARVDNDIYADDVPQDFQRVQEEFSKNERILKDLEETNEKFRTKDERIQQRFTILKRDWQNLTHKFKKFQKPADFDLKLKKVCKQLDEIEQALYMIELNSEDSDTIHLQLEHCIKFYKTLSDLKSQIESVLKQGRSIVDKKQVDNLDELTKDLDNLKFKYNELGSKVTNSKNDLEKGFKMSKKFRKEYSLLNDFMSKIDGELKKIELKPLSKNYPDELDWIKNTKTEINKVNTINLENLRSYQKNLVELTKTKKMINESLSSKISDIEQKIQNLKIRIQEREEFLTQQARLLDDLYDSFIGKSREMINQIERLQHELIEAERSQARDSIDEIERQLNEMFSEIESVRSQGTELCTKSEQYCKTVETELRSLLTNFEDLNRRVNLAQERFIINQDNQMSVTKTETIRQSRHAQESKYYRSKRSKSPSESSIDSSADVFDTELKQKYMRAVAYLRILDEIPLQESHEGQEAQEINVNYESENLNKNRTSEFSSIDIDFVIQQARQVAEMNENSNPERARRILEKVSKLEQRWNATKSKRNSYKSSSKLYERYKEREGNINDQIHILEEFSINKLQEEQQQQMDEESEFARYFYGPSDFIYEPSDFMQYNNQQIQNQILHKQSERYQDAYDTRSVISEPVQMLPIVEQTQQLPVTIRKYKTTKVTTTTHHMVPQQQQQQQMRSVMNSQMNSSQLNANQLNSQSYHQVNVPQSTIHRQSSHYYQNNESSNSNGRSSSIPPSLQKSQFMDQSYSKSNSQLDHSAHSASMKYMTAKNMSSSNNMSSNSTANHATFSQVPNHVNQASSNSCIDYSNTYYNSDWYLRHGGIKQQQQQQHLQNEQSFPTELPIYMQRS